MQSYQRFQHVDHTAFNTSGTNGPRLLSWAKVGTHSPLLKGSHTAAYTPKRGMFRMGRYHYPRHELHVHEHPRAGCQNGKLCRFWVLVGRCSRRTQRAFGTAMRLCVSLSRRRRGPAGLRDLFTFVEVAACMPCSRYFFRFSRRSSLCRSCASCVSARSFSARSSMVFGRNRQDFLL